MGKHTLHILAALVLFAVILYAPLAHAQKLPFTNYNTANGLTHNRTHVIRQDGKGYIWIGTDLGIDRYDGRAFKHYYCPDNTYHSSRYCSRYADSLVFCVDQFGIAICYGDSVRFIRLGTKNTGSISGVARLNDSTFYVVDQPHGFYKILAGKTQQIHLPASIIKEWNFVDVYKDRNANTWLLSALGLILFPASDATHPLNVPFFDKQYINSLRQDKNGDIYIACHEGVFRYAAADYNTILTVKPERILPAIAEITSIAFDAAGNIWMGSVNKGVYKYNKIRKTVNNYGIPNGLVSQYAWDVFCDKEHNLWVATENGISKLTTHNYSSFDFTNSDYQNIKSACVWNDSTLLFSNLVDVYSYANDSITKLRGYKNVPGYLEDMLLRAPDGRLLLNINNQIDAGSFSVGTVLCDVSNGELINKKVLSSMPGSIEQVCMSQGAAYYGDEMIVNTSSGLSVYKNGTFHQCTVFKNDSTKPQVTYLAGNTNGDLWFVQAHKDLVRYSKSKSDSGLYSYVFKQEEYIIGSKLGIKYCSKIYVDSKGNIWICSRGDGMCILSTAKNGSVTGIKHIDAKMFSNGIINDIQEDDYHNYWVGTASGLDKLVFSKDTFTVQKDIYGSNLYGKYIFFLRKLKNKLFVGTTGCLGVINLGQYEPQIVPEVYISGIRVNEKNELRLLNTKAEFKPNENFISFAFTGISFKDERRIRYSYMLDGINENWSEPQAEYTINYSRIPPGTYTFKVKAQSGQGVWSEPAIFTFSIRRPFYQQWWFIALVIVIITAAIYGIYRYRINQFIKIQNIRQAISKDLHDDIGATVSSINILANMAKSDLVSESKRNQFLESIQEDSKHVSESLNDIVWSINPKNDSLEIMFVRMQRYASELFEAKNIIYEFVLPDMQNEPLSMDMTKRQHVYLIFKEAVNNLIKYANATKAEVVLTFAKGAITIIITDNGIGFDSKAAYTGNGIFNMKKRAQDIGGSLEITSLPGNGTVIRLTVPA